VTFGGGQRLWEVGADVGRGDGRPGGEVAIRDGLNPRVRCRAVTGAMEELKKFRSGGGFHDCGVGRGGELGSSLGASRLVAQRPLAVWLPISMIFESFVMITWVAVNKASQPWSQSVPTERSAWLARPGKRWAWRADSGRLGRVRCGVGGHDAFSVW
jgi:hypothetical protein